MKKQILNFSIFLFLLAMFFGCVPIKEDPNVEADKAAINELYNQITLAIGAGDVDLYLSLFTEDAVIMPPEGKAVLGKKELRPIIEGLFNSMDLELPYSGINIEVSKNMAFARSGFTYSMTLKENGQTNIIIGKQLDILKRQTDGSWKLHIQCWNYNAPMGY